MSAIDMCLAELGYHPVPITGDYSTMGMLSRKWVDDDGTVIAETGLCEQGHPPTLIRPRPTVTWYDEFDGEWCQFFRVATAYDLDRLVERYGTEQVVRESIVGWEVPLPQVAHAR